MLTLTPSISNKNTQAKISTIFKNIVDSSLKNYARIYMHYTSIITEKWGNKVV